MNYPLLFVVGGLVAGMFGMERWCNWRLNVLQRRRATGQVTPPRRTVETSVPESAPALTGSDLPAQG